MKTVRVQYFAILREERGLAEEALATAAATAADLYEELRAKHAFTLPSERIRVAVNEEFASGEVSLKEDDRVVFLPPVAGG